MLYREGACEEECSEAVLQADRELIARCLTNTPAAWSELYEHCHEPLLMAIRSFLREHSPDVHLVDEIAARVWYLVVRNRGELLARFDAARGCRLTTFLSVLAKSEARQYFRAERRRRGREEAASRSEVDEDSSVVATSGISHEEFLEALTPSERKYYDTVLSTVSEVGLASFTNENGWQLRHRVRKKLSWFLEEV